MTDLIINGTAIRRTSLGGRRYYQGVLRCLDWSGKIEEDPLILTRRYERVAEMTRRGRRDAIYWSPSHRGPLFAHNHVVTVLDCINIEYVYHKDWRLSIIRAATAQLLNNAVRVVTISEATRDAVLRNFRVASSKVVAIPGPVFFPIDTLGGAVMKDDRWRSEPPFALMVTNSLPHKNTARAVSGFVSSSAARNGMRLLVIGSVGERSVSECRASGVVIEELHGIEDAALSYLFSNCAVYIAPSLDEGLDLPVAEALAMGAEVVCSDIPVHREFYEGAVRFFDPLDVNMISESIDETLDSEMKLNSFWHIKKRPSYSDVAVAYKNIFENIF